MSDRHQRHCFDLVSLGFPIQVKLQSKAKNGDRKLMMDSQRRKVSDVFKDCDRLGGKRKTSKAPLKYKLKHESKSYKFFLKVRFLI